jgi:hypothetical protein
VTNPTELLEGKTVLNRIKERCFGPSFATVVRRLAERNGWIVHWDTPRNAHLIFAIREHQFLVTVGLGENDSVAIMGHSNGEFLPGRFPPALRRALQARDRVLREMSWLVIDGKIISSAAVCARCPLASLDSSFFGRVVRRLLEEVELLDNGLRLNGVI